MSPLFFSPYNFVDKQGVSRETLSNLDDLTIVLYPIWITIPEDNGQAHIKSNTGRPIMKVYLKRDVPGLGKANEVKNVSDGYARNYLLPRGLAVPASEGNIKAAQSFAESQQARETRTKEHAQQIVDQLQQTPLHLKAKAGETGRLYGSITSTDIAEAIAKVLGTKFDKKMIVMKRHIREIGTHTVDLKLKGGVRGQVKVIVETGD